MRKGNGQPVVINNNGCCAGSGCGFALLVGLLVLGWESLPLWADLLISLGVVTVIALAVVNRLRPDLLTHGRQTGRSGPSATLTVVPRHAPTSPAPEVSPIAEPPDEAPPAYEATQSPSSATSSNSASIFEAIKSLAELHDSGVLTDAEFEGKKADLLSRL